MILTAIILRGKLSLFVRVKFKNVLYFTLQDQCILKFLLHQSTYTTFVLFLLYKIIYKAECVRIYAFLAQCFYMFGCNTKSIDDKKVFIQLWKQKVVLWTLQMCFRLEYKQCFEWYTI